METIRILHISDLHCGNENKPIGNVKESSVNKSIGNEILYDNCQELFLNNIKSLIETEEGKKVEIDLLACTGDLGDCENIDNIDKGIDYLAKLAGRLSIKPENVIICPGNHDLNRKIQGDKKIDKYLDACKKKGFKHAKWREPECLLIKGVPVLAFNTCIGGTEHDFLGIPNSLWDQISGFLKKIGDGKDTLKKFQALCVPAIGKSQIDKANDFLLQNKKNFVLVFTHYNLLPVPSNDVRPYANIVDSGTAISHLLSGGRRVLAFHGHTHCDSALKAQLFENEKSGFFSSIGSNC